MVVTIGLFVLIVHAKRQRPAAVCALHQPGEDLCRAVFLLAAARLDQLLHPVKDILADKGFMGIFHTNPFLFRLADLFLVLVRDVGLLIVDAVADIGFIFQDTFDLCNRPGVGLFLRRAGVNVGKGSVPLVVQPTGGGHFFRNQNAGDLGRASAMNGQIEDFLYDPAGFFVRCQRVLDLRVALVSQWRIGKDTFSLFKFRVERALYLAAGVLGKPLVEQILERHKLRQALFGVLVLSNGDIADLFLREHELQIIIHHHVFTPKTAEVFGNNAVDFPSFHIIHHPLKAGAVKS